MGTKQASSLLTPTAFRAKAALLPAPSDTAAEGTASKERMLLELHGKLVSLLGFNLTVAMDIHAMRRLRILAVQIAHPFVVRHLGVCAQLRIYAYVLGLVCTHSVNHGGVPITDTSSTC